MSMPPVALLLTDLVDSAATAQRLGDARMAEIWTAHDRIARDLLRTWRGQEIDKTDGFLLLFAQAADALGYVRAYHRALAALPEPMKARAGLHVGQITIRENDAADVALGAKRYEADGISKPIGARVMSAALGGQTLLTRAAMDALGPVALRTVSHGYWRVKGIPTPVELFEVGDDDAPFVPPPDSDKVFRVVRRDDLWLPLREMRHSLPAERDAFVGRRDLLQALALRFDEGARLLSLVGIGGGGKTRLAMRFGWAWMGGFPGGVWFCDLASARTVEGLAGAVSQGLQVPLGQDDPIEQIGAAIAGRGPCLVILDNFEQVARHAEVTVGRWLDRAPQASFLVTTREVLGIPGEEALALPTMNDADAQALFLRRAAAARSGFAPSADEQAAIAMLVKLLDGLPLAIELAAARVRTLAPRALLARMSERFKLLASSGGRQDRQATLRATFDWSWDLLGAAEKGALAQLSVFESGFTLEAAEAVIALDGLDDAPWTLDLVQSLVDKSFVRALAGERFDLLASVQEYAAGHLMTPGRFPGSGPQALADAMARHGRWYAVLGPRRAVQHACIELDNLSAACRRAVAAGDAALAAGALDGAWAALALRGPFTAGVDLAEAVCAMPGLQGKAAARAHAVLGAALAACGQRALAQRHCEAALGQAKANGDAACEAEVRVRLAGLQARAGDTEAARAGHAHALSLARGLADAALECEALNGLGTVEHALGRMDAARVHWNAALEVARATGDRRWQGSLLGNLGNLQASIGRLDEARALFEEALAAALEIGDRKRAGDTRCNLGMLHCLQGRLQDAAALLEMALADARDLGHARLESIVLGNLGMVHAETGHHAEALARYGEAVTAARRIGDRRTEGQLLGHLGLAQARTRSHEAASASLEAGDAILRAAGDRMSLGLLQCARAEAAWLRGAPAEARAALEEAALLAEQSGAGAGSELGAAMQRLRGLFTAEAGADEPALSR